MVSSRILAIDYGEKRIGLALSDPLQIISRPYLVLENQGEAVYEEIEQIIRNENVGKVVLGLPVNLEGDDTRKTSEVKEFARKLISVISVPLEYWDERYSTVEAHKMIKRMKIDSQKARKIIDKIAASIILEDYLENLKK